MDSGQCDSFWENLKFFPKELIWLITNLSHTSTKHNIILFLPQTCLMLWDDAFGMLISVSLKIVKKKQKKTQQWLNAFNFKYSLILLFWILRGNKTFFRIVGAENDSKANPNEIVLSSKWWGVQKNWVWIGRVQLKFYQNFKFPLGITWAKDNYWMLNHVYLTGELPPISEMLQL